MPARVAGSVRFAKAPRHAARILRDYDGRYGAEKGPVSADAFLEAAYQSLSAEAKPPYR